MERKVVFHAGEHGVSSMRIPGMVTSTEGTLLAFCEARDGGDRTPTDLVLKRSEDGGRTWGPLQLVVKARGLDAIMNPCPVVDASTGTVHCFSNIFPGGGMDLHRQPGKVRTIISRSDDDGLTWSSPDDITGVILDVSKDYGKVTGPGAGIQTDGGRLVIPFGLGPEEKCRGMIVYSDDHGERWRAGGRTKSTSSEMQLVELSDGSLRLDMRNQNSEEKPKHCRYYSISRDGGATWTEPVRDLELLDTSCQASILRHPFRHQGQERVAILFANPASTFQKRVNMTVRMSYDDGNTWPVARTLYPGPCDYCSLVSLPDETVGILYSNGEGANRCTRMTFARFDLEWLTQGRICT